MYVQNMFKICSKHVQNMFKICSKYVQNMFKICSKYVQTMLKKFSKYVQNMFKICPKYVQNMFKICPKYVQNMSKVCSKYVQNTIICLGLIQFTQNNFKLTFSARHFYRNIICISKFGIFHSRILYKPVCFSSFIKLLYLIIKILNKTNKMSPNY